jgi:hypothetical protein
VHMYISPNHGLFFRKTRAQNLQHANKHGRKIPVRKLHKLPTPTLEILSLSTLSFPLNNHHRRGTIPYVHSACDAISHLRQPPSNVEIF